MESFPEDDSNEPYNLKLNNSPCFETKAINLNTTHFNITEEELKLKPL